MRVSANLFSCPCDSSFSRLRFLFELLCPADDCLELAKRTEREVERCTINRVEDDLLAGRVPSDRLSCMTVGASSIVIAIKDVELRIPYEFFRLCPDGRSHFRWRDRRHYSMGT